MKETEIQLIIKLQQQLFADPKRIRLLKSIKECGSINQAAKNAKVSYKSAWDHLEAMNAISPKPLLERNAGGKNGGGTDLTKYAKRLLQLYDLLEKTQKKAFDILQDDQIPLDSLLSATAKFSPQSSARNQFFGKVKNWTENGIKCDVTIDIAMCPQPMIASITQASRERLQLIANKEVMLMIKAPWLKLHHSPINTTNCFFAKIQDITHNNSNQEIALQLGKLQCYATTSLHERFTVNQQIWVTIDPEHIVLLTL